MSERGEEERWQVRHRPRRPLPATPRRRPLPPLPPAIAGHGHAAAAAAYAATLMLPPLRCYDAAAAAAAAAAEGMDGIPLPQGHYYYFPFSLE